MPTLIEEDKQWTATAEGSEHMAGSLSLGVTNDNKVFAWGGNNNGQSAIGPIYIIQAPTEVIMPIMINSKGKCMLTKVMWG